MQVIRCALSGSYRRDFRTLERDYRELVANGCQILSPHRLDIVNPEEAFVKDGAEVDLSAYEIERHHLLALRQADFLWLHCPNGYIGVSGAMEVGYALALGIPIFAKVQPNEVVFERQITIVPSVFMAIEMLRTKT